MVVKPIINIATRYTDDIVGSGVRKWAKPTSFKRVKELHSVKWYIVALNIKV